MKILHLIGTYQTFGGMEKHVADLAAEQAKSPENQVLVACHPLIAQRIDAPVATRQLPMQLGRHNPFLFLKTLRAIRDFQPDILHIHGRKAASLAALAARLRLLPKSTRTVATIHNTRKPAPAFRHFHSLIAVSHAIAHTLAETFPELQPAIIWNGIAPNPPRDAPPADIPASALQHPIVISIARLARVKGTDILIDAWPDILTIYPTARLWIVGDGEQQAELEAKTSSAGIQDSVWFAGYRQDATQLLALADLVAIPSRREGFNYVFAEALLQQKPLITTDTADFSRFLPSSLITSGFSPRSLATTLIAALDDLPATHRAMQPAWELARQNLSLEAMARKTDRIYRQTLHPEPRTSAHD